MPQARDEAGNIWETDAQGNAVRLVTPASQTVPTTGGIGPITLGTPSPKAQYEGPQAAANLSKAQTDALNAAATSDATVAKAKADAAKAQADAKVAQITASQGGQGKLTAEVREGAISGYQAADNLQNAINDIKAKYAAGPGATSGIKGLLDYLPTPANKNFDDAGNAARAFIGPVLALKASQLNTEKEAQRAVGPYLPESSDYDSEILNKISRLQGLVDSGRQTAIKTLGGVPDAQGNITPVQRQALPIPGGIPPAVPPSGGGINGPTPSGGGPMLSIAAGATRNEPDPQTGAAIEQMIRNGASPDQIKAAFPNNPIDPNQVASVQSYLKQHPDYSGFVDATKGVQNSLLTRIAGSPLGAGVISAGDAVVPLKPFLSNDQAAAMDQAKAQSPNASLLGSLIGGIPAAAGLEMGAARLLPGAPVAAARTADATYGGIQGAGNDTNDPLTGGAVGAGAGLLGGMVGRGIANGVTDPSVQYLRSLNIPTTVGQTLGGLPKRLEDAATSIPIVGDVINNRRREGMQAFNQAGFDQALAPLQAIPGYQGPATTNGVAEAGIDAARGMRSQGYDAALHGVSVGPDPQFNQDFANTVMAGRNLPDPMAGRSDFAMRQAGQQIDPTTQTLDGNGFQQAIRGIRRARNDNANEVNGYDLGQVMGQGESAFNDLLNRQAPGVVPAYNTANEVNRNVEVLRDAVNRARNGSRTGETGLFAPSQLSDAAAANARRFGNTQGTTDQPFFDLTRAGQEVLPSKIGDSGTFTRQALTAIPLIAGGGGIGALAGGGEGAETGGAAAAGTGLLAALLGSRTAQRGLVAALADRPDIVRQFATQIGSSLVPVSTAFGNVLTQ